MVFPVLEFAQLTAPKKEDGCRIHPSAIICKGAEIGQRVSVGPHAYIGPKVVLHDDVEVGLGAVIEGRTEIGTATQIFAHASIGSRPQDLKYQGEDTRLIIGKENRIREYVNISLGTEQGGGLTRIGDRNLFMVFTHVGHDCLIDNDCIFANGVQLAGHVEVASQAVFGGLSAVHQFARIGRLVMVAAASMVRQDVVPFCMVHGDPAKPAGLNVVGLRRGAVQLLSDAKLMYKILFHQNKTVDEAVKSIESEVAPSPSRDEFLAFVTESKRGLSR